MSLNRLLVTPLTVAAMLASVGVAAAKTQKTISEKIVISATPEKVFDAIRAQRNSEQQHRKQASLEGNKAVIDEAMEGVAVYGKVHCTWEETEEPFTRIDYKLLQSDKFKSGFGSWILTPEENGTKTELEFTSFLDTGLKIPFAAEITRMAAHKDARERLEHIKQVAEHEK